MGGILHFLPTRELLRATSGPTDKDGTALCGGGLTTHLSPGRRPWLLTHPPGPPAAFFSSPGSSFVGHESDQITTLLKHFCGFLLPPTQPTGPWASGPPLPTPLPGSSFGDLLSLL